MQVLVTYFTVSEFAPLPDVFSSPGSFINDQRRNLISNQSALLNFIKFTDEKFASLFYVLLRRKGVIKNYTL